ncbi:MAG: LON peptidase substrate-binding domain-containing protein [Anaerolineae bacterium]|nr:LON peptidase substrate-binding domain-containing protein [Thermoflexales bacterium]MDW8406979.1 LON peptidase substrate-binding domain-containing protein [Anaerolineae bacterium]
MKAEVVELPLFPLNVVLFPGQTLPLHIFEPRYRAMIQRCIENDAPFGVLLAQDDDEGPHTIGTAAKITQVERLPDGRMNILTVGTERFELRNVRLSEEQYLIGDVVAYPFKNDLEPPAQLQAEVAARLQRYLKLLSKLTGIEFKTRQFPEDATALAVFAAIAMQLPLEDKQELLATERVADMLSLEAEILEDELFTLAIMAAAMPPPETNSSIPFSVN